MIADLMYRPGPHAEADLAVLAAALPGANRVQRLLESDSPQGLIIVRGGKRPLPPAAVLGFVSKLGARDEYIYADLTYAGHAEISFEFLPAGMPPRASDPAWWVAGGPADMRRTKGRAVAFEDRELADFVASSPENHFAYPSNITLEPSAGCNLKCTMCHFQVTRAPAHRRGPLIMPRETYGKLADEISAWPIKPQVEFGFRGEPLVSKNIVDMVDRFHVAGCTTLINSNAQLADADLFLRLADAGLSFFSFSVDALDKSTYERIRVGASFERLMDNIETAIDLYGQRPDAPKIIVKCVRMSSNDRDWDPIFQRLQHRVHCVVLQNEVVFEEGQYRSRHMFRQNDRTFCILPFTVAAITAAGAVYNCACTDGEELGEQLGDITQQSFLEIWNGAKQKELRRQMLSLSVEQPYQCTRCSRQPCSAATIHRTWGDGLVQVELEGARYTTRT